MLRHSILIKKFDLNLIQYILKYIRVQYKFKIVLFLSCIWNQLSVVCLCRKRVNCISQYPPLNGRSIKIDPYKISIGLCLIHWVSIDSSIAGFCIKFHTLEMNFFSPVAKYTIALVYIKIIEYNFPNALQIIML